MLQNCLKIIAGFLLLSLCVFEPFLRFTNACFNNYYIAFVELAVLLGVLIGISIVIKKHKSKRIKQFFYSLLLLFVFIIVLVCSLFIFLAMDFDKCDLGFKKIHQIDNVVAYQTDGGATTDFGIIVRKEKLLLPGLIFIRPLCSAYHKEDIEIKKENNRIFSTDPECQFTTTN